jgi:hypothetical protein
MTAPIHFSKTFHSRDLAVRRAMAAREAIVMPLVLSSRKGRS